MVEKVLNAAGIKFVEGSFRQPPKTTYAVYLDDVEIRGADNINLIEEHSVTIELYEYSKDIEAEHRIEQAFDDFGMPYERQSRTWIDTEQLYQVIYEFDYIVKKEN